MSIIHKSGFLTKQGEFVKNWRRRWFVLSDDGIYYYKDENRDLKGDIPLVSIKGAFVAANSKKPALRIQTQDRDFICQVQTVRRAQFRAQQLSVYICVVRFACCKWLVGWCDDRPKRIWKETIGFEPSTRR